MDSTHIHTHTMLDIKAAQVSKRKSIVNRFLSWLLLRTLFQVRIQKNPDA